MSRVTHAHSSGFRKGNSSFDLSALLFGVEKLFVFLVVSVFQEVFNLFAPFYIPLMTKVHKSQQVIGYLNL